MPTLTFRARMGVGQIATRWRDRGRCVGLGGIPTDGHGTVLQSRLPGARKHGRAAAMIPGTDSDRGRCEPLAVVGEYCFDQAGHPGDGVDVGDQAVRSAQFDRVPDRDRLILERHAAAVGDDLA